MDDSGVVWVWDEGEGLTDVAVGVDDGLTIVVGDVDEFGVAGLWVEGV